MTIDIQERESEIKSSVKGALVVGLLALIFLFPSIRSALNLGSGDTKCESWPSRQGQWYSVPPELLTLTADYPRMVDKTGVWAKSGFGLTNGWIYAAKTPAGPLAYWAVAEDEIPLRAALYDSERHIIETRFDTWWGLNDEAVSLSLSATRSALGINSANVSRMLTDKIKDSIAHCLGY
jgi:hypothetical protein